MTATIIYVNFLSFCYFIAFFIRLCIYHLNIVLTQQAWEMKISVSAQQRPLDTTAPL